MTVRGNATFSPCLSAPAALESSVLWPQNELIFLILDQLYFRAGCLMDQPPARSDTGGGRDVYLEVAEGRKGCTFPNLCSLREEVGNSCWVGMILGFD